MTRPFIKMLVLLVVGALVFAAGAQAEVSVEISSTGEYLGYNLHVNQSSSKPKIWEFKRSGKRNVHALNVAGDQLGDGLPAIEENATGDGYPWAVWTAGTGRLSWSRWTGAAWSAIRTVTGAASTLQSQPDLAFNSGGRAYLGFTQQAAGGKSEVYFTIFMASTWAQSIRVSGDLEDASSPSLEILDDQTVEVTYSLQGGTSKTVTVRFADPSTITDDVYPFLTDTAEVLEGGPV